jgi:3',5'-cyclic AMP phosphodiesterase CpdA
MSAPEVGDRAPVRLLVTGDLHLGRTPRGVPPGEPALDVAAVLSSVADQALARGVDALVLTGDLADAGNKHFEAAGVLERVFRRLADAGLPVFVVAGDHDHDAAVHAVEAVGSPLVRLLGRGQTWEVAPLDRNGHAVLRLVGWSFAGPHVPESPLDSFPTDLGDGPPVVGVLHADLNAPGSRVAPVTADGLRSAPVAAWLLGHDHDQSVDGTDGPVVVRPGSLQPLGPDEPGVHGAVLVTVEADGAVTADPVPLATVHYCAVDVDLSAAADAAGARALCAAALREHASAVREGSPAVVRAVTRVRLVGRTAAFGSVDALAAELRADGDVAHAGLTVGVGRVEVAAGPDLDLGRLAAGSGAVATLARLSARLGTDGPLDESALGPADRALVRGAAEAVRAARVARVFEPLAADGRLDADAEVEVVGRLRRQVSRLLDAALAQNADA